MKKRKHVKKIPSEIFITSDATGYAYPGWFKFKTAVNRDAKDSDRCMPQNVPHKAERYVHESLVPTPAKVTIKEGEIYINGTYLGFYGSYPTAFAKRLRAALRKGPKK